MTSETLSKVAIAIGAASADPDERFVAKHWAKAADEASQEARKRLLAQAQAAVKALSNGLDFLAYGIPFEEDDDLPVTSNGETVRPGGWVRHHGGNLFGQVLAIDHDERVLIHWFPRKGSAKSSTQTSRYSYSDVESYADKFYDEAPTELINFEIVGR